MNYHRIIIILLIMDFILFIRFYIFARSSIKFIIINLIFFDCLYISFEINKYNNYPISNSIFFAVILIYIASLIIKERYYTKK